MYMRLFRIRYCLEHDVGYIAPLASRSACEHLHAYLPVPVLLLLYRKVFLYKRLPHEVPVDGERELQCVYCRAGDSDVGVAP